MFLCWEWEVTEIGKVALGLMCLLTKVAEIDAFGNPNAKSIYIYLKENGLLFNSKFSDTGTNINCCQIVRLFSEKFLPLGFTVDEYMNN